MSDTATNSTTLRRDVIEALRVIIDPEIGRSIIDMGLIYSVSILDGGIAEISMTTTSRGCPATTYLREAVADCAWNVPGIEYAEVLLTYEPPWTPDMMDAGDNSLLALPEMH